MTSTTDDRKAYWQPHVEAWRASGMSGKQFSQQHALSYSQLLYWNHKLYPKQSAQDGAFARVIPAAADSERSRSAGPGDGLQITLPNGVRIGGINAGNVDVLRSVLGQL
ncbi:MAG: hypothetical protein VBE63_24700 [Lamprobacter sp.]|uniref:IS66 family insertion sequence element accessory protein TnpA n=1 Tax=Lamprobacter sp. TaxID=3100796 RepID=UPI002B25C4F3|nr:hypothetical protein [Lamprobacter sp.]MEA3643113.1 hypothetical protein [Lamprobacter sp.]